MKFIFYFVCWLSWGCQPITPSISIGVDLTASQGDTLERFWTSTGFSPTPSSDNVIDFIQSKDVELNLALIGSIPNRGMTHVRIHWLLDIVTANCERDDAPWEYDFKNLDQILNWLRTHQLSPGFELMGNPSNCFQDLTIEAPQWFHLVQLLIQRYIDTFGVSYIRTWRIETINEPDLKMYNRLNLTWPSYLAYINATSAALSTYNLSLWGPAGLFKNVDKHPLCWGLLQHCNSHPCPVQVLSYHKKGDGVASLVVQRGEDLITLIRASYPNLSHLPVANDEADPLTGWIQPVRWRADVRYAAAAAQIMIGHLHSSRQNAFNLAAISNDNGFLSYRPNFWTQRTLLARFQMNNTFPTHVQMFRKPIHSVMGIMSLLGAELTSIQYNPGNPGWSLVSSMEGSRRAILVTINNDTLLDEPWVNQTLHMKLRLKLPPTKKNGQGVVTLLDNQVSNPELVWFTAGQPNFPDKHLRRKIREKENPQTIRFGIGSNETMFVLDRHIFVPSVFLINICYGDEMPPGPVHGLRGLQVTQNEMLLLWSDSRVRSKCVETFVVEFRPRGRRRFRPITRTRILTTSFQFDGCVRQIGGKCKETNIRGSYRVAALDFWNRTGPYSNQILL